MAAERRTIWLSDERWAALKERADKRGQSPSALIWDLFTGGPPQKAMTQDPAFAAFRPVPKPSQRGSK